MFDRTGRNGLRRELVRATPDPSPAHDGPEAASPTIQALNDLLAGSDSATLALERWCEAHGLVDPARIVVQRLFGCRRMPGAPRCRRLRVRAHEHVCYRRVLLRCGPLILCEAENWYIRERLSPRMNNLLERTARPFGRVVGPLRFRRHNLSADILPPGIVAAGAAVSRHAILRHQAILTLPSGEPFCEVVESFMSDLLPAGRSHGVAILQSCEPTQTLRTGGTVSTR